MGEQKTRFKKADVLAILDRLEPGERLIMIFYPEGKAEIPYLLGMLKGRGILDTDSSTHATLLAVTHSGSWGRESNRVITVTPTARFQPDWFADRLYRALASLEVVEGEATIAQRLLMDERGIPLEQIQAAAKRDLSLETVLDAAKNPNDATKQRLWTRAEMIYRFAMNRSDTAEFPRLPWF